MEDSQGQSLLAHLFTSNRLQPVTARYWQPARIASVILRSQVRILESLEGGTKGFVRTVGSGSLAPMTATSRKAAHSKPISDPDRHEIQQRRSDRKLILGMAFMFCVSGL
jgi:hypothetical protein